MKRNPPPPPDQGNIITVRVDDSAAGAEWETVVPPGRVWRFMSGRALFTADANVASRYFRLHFLDGSDITGGIVAAAPFAAGVAGQLYYSPGATLAPTSPGLNAVASGPNYVLLRPGDILKSDTENIQAGDVYSEIVLRVEEWVEA